MVELDIKADSPHEMMQLLRLLTNPSLDVPVAPEWSQTGKFDPAQLPADMYVADDEQPTAGATQDAEPGEPKRRTRRTKAEMDAARGAEASTSTGSTESAASSSPTVQGADTSSADGDDVVTDEVVGAVMKSALEKLKEQGKTAMDLRELLISATKHIIPEGASNRTALNTPELRAAAVAAMRTLL